MALQTLICRHGDHTWSRVASRGKPPHYCPEHSKYGPARQQEQKAPGAPQEQEPQEQEQKAPETPQGAPGEHYRQAELLEVVLSGCHAMLVGPAASGKTTAAKVLARALGLPVYIESCSPGMSPWDLMGFNGATGTYVPGFFRQAAEFGGVCLLDEMDAANPETLVAVNNLAAADAGEPIPFKDATVARHENFVLVAGANTSGDGMSDRYVGRQQLDAATLDRFPVIDWDYDERLEMEIGPVPEWTAHVQKVRKIVEAQKLPLLITPRASIYGGRMLKRGKISRERVEALTIYKKADKDVVRAVKTGLKAL